jgi:predicted small lipoprotein YifL
MAYSVSAIGVFNPLKTILDKPKSELTACSLRAALVILCLALAACGQRGPLYLPDEQAVPGTMDTAVEDENDKGDDEETP